MRRSSFPFECGSEEDIEESYDYLVSYITQQGMDYSGNTIVHLLLTKMAAL